MADFFGDIVNGLGSTVEDLTGLNTSNSSSSDRALAAQQGAAHEANETQRYMYDTTRADNAPWRQAGVTALAGMQDPNFQKSFTAADFQADPGYQFRMAEGQKAIARASSANGLFSTGTLKSLTNFNQGLASQEYGNAYNRFNNDATTRFNRLASMAGAGQTANAQNQQANETYANAYGNNVEGAANATAAQSVAQGNQRSALMGQIAQGYGMKASDIRVKENIKPVSKEEMNELRANLKAYKFNYTSPEFGEGEHVGVMAQDLEKSKLGRTLVKENENGVKEIDIGKVMCLFLATLAEG